MRELPVSLDDLAILLTQDRVVGRHGFTMVLTDPNAEDLEAAESILESVKTILEDIEAMLDMQDVTDDEGE